MTKIREEKLIIELDNQKDKKLPRYSGCIHKSHNSIKKAIEKLPKLKIDLESLNQ